MVILYSCTSFTRHRMDGHLSAILHHRCSKGINQRCYIPNVPDLTSLTSAPSRSETNDMDIGDPNDLESAKDPCFFNGPDGACLAHSPWLVALHRLRSNWASWPSAQKYSSVDPDGVNLSTAKWFPCLKKQLGTSQLTTPEIPLSIALREKCRI